MNISLPLSLIFISTLLILIKLGVAFETYFLQAIKCKIVLCYAILYSVVSDFMIQPCCFVKVEKN